MFKKRNPGVSLAFQYSLLFLALTVFGWGLRAKLALYHSDSPSFSTIGTTAKLAIEDRSARSIVAAHSSIKPRFTPDSMCWADLVFDPRVHDVPLASRFARRPGPNVPAVYNLLGPEPMRRPPPALS